MQANKGQLARNAFGIVAAAALLVFSPKIAPAQGSKADFGLKSPVPINPEPAKIDGLPQTGNARRRP